MTTKVTKNLTPKNVKKVGIQYETKNGRLVKSEGGITPDISLPIETYENYVKTSDLCGTTDRQSCRKLVGN